jgi:hypothetical protein
MDKLEALITELLKNTSILQNVYVVYEQNIAFYLESHTNTTNKLCGVNTERFPVKVNGSYTNRCALNSCIIYSYV